MYLSVVSVEHAEELDHHLVGHPEDEGGLLQTNRLLVKPLSNPDVPSVQSFCSMYEFPCRLVVG